jgi:spore coat polysaccharide biosynthesis protein SpsF (cytidylyltransferase family)
MLGIVICSRLSSSRLPNKAHLLLEGKTVISHLVSNLKDLGIPIIIAVPHNDFEAYLTDATMPREKHIFITQSEYAEDPLARTYHVAKQFKLSAVIRITHDKIFIDTDGLKEAVQIFLKEKPDYLYASGFIPGTNFEFISYQCLAEASHKFKNIEHISYAARYVSKKTIAFTRNQSDFNLKNVSLLLDYKDDLKLFEVIYSQVGVNARMKSVFSYLNSNREMIKINQKPTVSIYTCAYNADEFLENAIDSVVDQSIFAESEYILIDDHSGDSTFEIMARHGIKHKNINYHRNPMNIGLASSSNIALAKAKGKYIIRIDADDFFCNPEIIKEMVQFIERTSNEILYPDNFNGCFSVIQKGNEFNHVGGSLFSKSALNFIKFTDGLRGFEGYDLFHRAKDRLKIGYFEKPAFFYTKRENSMSRSNPKMRSQIKADIDKRLKGN